MYQERLTKKNIEKLDKSITDCTIKCKCGHSIVITPRTEKTLCKHCGYYVFRNKEDEFKFRLKEMLNRVNK